MSYLAIVYVFHFNRILFPVMTVVVVDDDDLCSIVFEELYYFIQYTFQVIGKYIASAAVAVVPVDL